MRRMVLGSTTKAATLHARVVLAAISLAVLLVLAWTLAAPAAAQQTEDVTQRGDDEAAGRATESLQGAEALIIEDVADETVDRIEIAATDCEVEKGAVVTVEGESGRAATFTNAPDDGTRDADEVDATIEPTEDQVIIEVTDDTNLDTFGTEDASEDGTVSSFTGITCGREAGGAAAGDGNGNGEKDDLENLSCDKLLVLFRGGGQGQYGDADILTNRDARARIEVCLKKEIVQGTAADGNLPDTGGLSLIGVAALGAATAVAALSVIRGGRR